MSSTEDPTGGRPAYLLDHGAAVEEIGRPRWGAQPDHHVGRRRAGLTDEQLRDRLLALADQTRPSGH